MQPTRWDWINGPDFEDCAALAAAARELGFTDVSVARYGDTLDIAFRDRNGARRWSLCFRDVPSALRALRERIVSATIDE